MRLLFVLFCLPILAGEISEDTQTKLAATMADHQEEYGIVGQAVAILHNGQFVYVHSHGEAVKEWNVPATPQTIFQLFSISKLFALTNIMMDVELGRLDLQTPVGQILEDLPPAWQQVTVLELMNHTSGLPDYYGPRPTPPTAEAALDSVRHSPMDFPTATENRYNQTNYLLLKMILEKVRGVDYGSYLGEIFTLSGLQNTQYGNQYAVIQGRATTYEATPHGLAQLSFVDQPPYMMTATGLNSNVLDLAHWFSKLLAGGFFSTKHLETMWAKPMLKGDRPGRFAHGWEYHEEGGVRAVGHGGGGRNDVRHFTKGDESITVIFLSNGGSKSYNPRDLSQRLANAFSKDTWFPQLALSDQMYQLAKHNKWSQAQVLYRNYLAQHPDLSLENMVNTLGYRLLNTKGAGLALPVFQFNIAEHPESANPYDSLAETYLSLGDKVNAKKYYRKAQSIAPNDRVAEILSKL